MSDGAAPPTRASSGAAGSPAARPRSSRRCPARRTSTGGSRSTTSPARTPTPRRWRPPACSPPTRRPSCTAGSTCSPPGSPPASSGPTRRTRTCTAPSSGCWSRRSAPTSAASCAPAGPATTRSPPCSAPTCSTTRARSARWCWTSSRRSPARPSSTSARSCRGAPISSTRSRCCSRTTCSRTPGRCCATSTGSRDWRRRVESDSPYGSGALAGQTLGLDPELVARELDFTGSTANSIDGTVVARLRRRVRLRRRPDRRRRQPDRRGGHPLGDPRVRLRPAARLLVDRVEHHAAEEEPRHRRAGPRQGRPAGRQPDRAADDAEGAAARLQPGPAGGQGAGLRLRRHPRGAAAGVHRNGRDPRVRHRADGRAGTAGLLAGHRRRGVAGPGGRAVPGRARGRRRLRPALRGARRRAARAHRRAVRGDLPEPDPCGALGAHGRGVGRGSQRPRRHRAGAPCAPSSPSCGRSLAEHRERLARPA